MSRRRFRHSPAARSFAWTSAPDDCQSRRLAAESAAMSTAAKEWKPYYEPADLPFSRQRSKARASVSFRVGKKLDSTAGVWRLCSPRDQPVQLYIRDNFLSAEECSG